MAARKAPTPLPRAVRDQFIADVTSGLANASDAILMNVVLAFSGATIAATPGTKMCVAVEIIERAGLGTDVDVGRVRALVLDLAHLVDPAFRAVVIDASDAVFFADYASAVTRAAYLTVRSGACGERRRAKPSREDIERVARKIKQARRRAQRKVAVERFG